MVRKSFFLSQTQVDCWVGFCMNLRKCFGLFFYSYLKKKFGLIVVTIVLGFKGGNYHSLSCEFQEPSSIEV